MFNADFSDEVRRNDRTGVSVLIQSRKNVTFNTEKIVDPALCVAIFCLFM